MSEQASKPKYLDAQQVIHLPRWAKFAVMGVLAILAISSASTAFIFLLAEQAILGNPAGQLFWVQDIAMMTQSVARTALRNNIVLYTNTEPGPL